MAFLFGLIYDAWLPMFSYLCVEFGDVCVSDMSFMCKVMNLCSVSNSINLITIVIIVLLHLFESI